MNLDINKVFHEPHNKMADETKVSKMKAFGEKFKSIKSKMTLNSVFVTLGFIGAIVKGVNFIAYKKFFADGNSRDWGLDAGSSWKKTVVFTDLTLGGLVAVAGLVAAWDMLDGICRTVRSNKPRDKSFYMKVVAASIQFVLFLMTMKMLLFYPYQDFSTNDVQTGTPSPAAVTHVISKKFLHDRNMIGMLGGIFAVYMFYIGNSLIMSYNRNSKRDLAKLVLAGIGILAVGSTLVFSLMKKDDPSKNFVSLALVAVGIVMMAVQAFLGDSQGLDSEMPESPLYQIASCVVAVLLGVAVLCGAWKVLYNDIKLKDLIKSFAFLGMNKAFKQKLDPLTSPAQAAVEED